jgi:hypothetical protein
MKLPVLFLVLTSAATAFATVRHIPIKSGLTLQPGQAYTVSLNVADPVEIGWTAVQSKPCSTNCIEVAELNKIPSYGYATGLGGSKDYTPVSGKIAVEYKNVSQEPVTIDVYRVERICDAESCRFFDNKRKGHTLVFKVDEFKSITSSSDQSYSVISGVAMSGRPFQVRVIWFSDDKNVFRPACAVWIKRYLDNHVPKDHYRPYVISGQSVGDGDNLILRSVDDCVPNAPHFGVLSEDEVFK